MRYIAIVIASVLVGCASTVHRGVDVGLEEVHKAAERAIKELKLSPGASNLDFQMSVVRATTADGRRVTIRSEKVAAGHTTIEVLVGDFPSEHNRATAQSIHDHLLKILGK